MHLGVAASPTAKRFGWRAITAFLLLAILSALILGTFQLSYTRHIESRFAHAEAALKTLRSVLEREYGVLDRVTEQAIQLLNGRDPAEVSEVDLHRIKSTAEAPVANSRVSVNFWRTDGKSFQSSAAGIDISDRDYFLAHTAPQTLGPAARFVFRAESDLAIGSFVLSRLRNDIVIIVSRPIRSPTGRLLGLVVASIPIQSLIDAVAHQRRSDEDVIYVIRADGRGLLRIPPDPRFESADLAASPVVKHYPERQSGRYEGVAKTDGVLRKGSFLGLNSLPLVIGYSFPVGAFAVDAFSNLKAEFAITAATFLVASAFAIFAFLSVQRSETARAAAALSASIAQRNAVELSLESARLNAITARMNTLLSSANDAILILDSEMRVTFFNRAAEAIFGVRSADIVGATIDRFIPAGSRARHTGLMSSVAHGPDFARIMSDWRGVEAQHASGRTFPAMISISKSSEAGVVTFLVIVRDMTESLAAEKRLRTLLAEQKRLASAAVEADAAKSNFLAAMSHELRTPLNAIIGYSEALDLGYAGPLGSPKVREYVADILNSGRHLHGLIDQILDLSRLQNRDAIDLHAVTDLDEALRESLHIIELRARERSISIELTPQNLGRQVAGEKRTIMQVLLNVMVNAVKFSPAGSEIRLAIRDADERDGTTVTIEDSGPGISDAILARIGRPFTQDRDLLIAGNDGVGLGLSIVKEILDRLGGAIKFTNRSGGGLRVEINLPAPTAPQP